MLHTNTSFEIGFMEIITDHSTVLEKDQMIDRQELKYIIRKKFVDITKHLARGLLDAIWLVKLVLWSKNFRKFFSEN